MRFIFYSHDGQGLGHVRRNLAVAAAVTSADSRAQVLVISSSDHVDDLVLPEGVDVLKVPGLRKVDNGEYEAKRLLLSAPEVRDLRSGLITAATRLFAPDVLLADKHPLGAHGELRGALDWVRRHDRSAVLGLRDILDTPVTVRQEWERGGVLPAIAEHYGRVLVYGCRSVLDPVVAYGMPAEVAQRLTYCGYVASTPESSSPAPLVRSGDGRPVVLATAGAGTDGYALLSSFLRSSQGAPWHPVVVSGGDASPSQQERLQAAAAAVGGTYRRFVRDLTAHFPSVAAVVTMGGYNTLTECLQAGVPTVVVPRVHPRQEQLIRARAFADLGLLRVVLPDQLAGPALGHAVRGALLTERSQVHRAAATAIDLSGAERAAQVLLSSPRHASRPLRNLPHLEEPVDVAV